MTAESLTLVVLALIGASIGSFLNVCIYRLPRRESLVWPASHCTSCGRTLAWYENVPIVGWLALRWPLPHVRRAHLDRLSDRRGGDRMDVRDAGT